MWLRTTMNYQYANGGSLTNAITTLYKEGGKSSDILKDLPEPWLGIS